MTEIKQEGNNKQLNPGGRDPKTGRFVKGVENKGRKKGSKNKYTKKYQDAIYKEWEKQGDAGQTFLVSMANGTHPLLERMDPEKAAKMMLDCIKQIQRLTLNENAPEEVESLAIMSPSQALNALGDAKEMLNAMDSLNHEKDITPEEGEVNE